MRPSFFNAFPALDLLPSGDIAFPHGGKKKIGHQTARDRSQYVEITHALPKLLAYGIAVAIYNEVAADFKQTTVYKELLQSRELLEQPDTSRADVFEVNPTEVEPTLE